MRRAKKPLKKPFVVTLSAVAAAAAAVACGGIADDGGKGQTQINPPPTVPTSVPGPITNPPGLPGPAPTCPSTNVNDSCQTEGDTCTGGCGSNCHCFCGRWLGDNMTGSCNPPAFACPTNAPTPGDACNLPSTMTCSYPNPSSPCPAPEYQCDATKRTWTAITSSCNPPPPDAGTD